MKHFSKKPFHTPHRKRRIGKFEYSWHKATITTKEWEIFFVFDTYRSGYFHGDIVEFTATRPSDGQRLPEARIESCIQHAPEPILASIEVSGKKRENGKIRLYLKALSGFWDGTIKSIGPIIGKEWDIVIVRLEGTWEIPHGKILRNLWNKGEKNIDEKILLFRYNIRTNFSQDVLMEAEQYTPPSRFKETSETCIFWSESFPIVETEHGKRVDFRSWHTTTIDGKDAKDLDDAISLWTLGNSHILLWVHIADVSNYVIQESKLDHESFLRGTSIYFPGKVIPMLPEYLSNNLCSLHPWSIKNTLSVLMEIDSNGWVVASKIVESIIESSHQSTYDEVYDFISTQDTSLHSPEWNNTITQAYSLFKILEKRRKKEWKILFTTTECVYEFDEHKNITNIRKRDRNDAHMLIEECMVLANEEVAKWCSKNKIAFVSRIHEAPSIETIQVIQSILGKNDIEKTLTPKIIRDSLDSMSEKNQYRLSKLLLPKMTKAVYKEKPLWHFWLALDFYSHFTSPIRRYPDLLLHRIIKHFLHTQKWLYSEKDLKVKSDKSSLRERTAETISRALEERVKCLYMKPFIGDIYDGIISGITERNIYIELSNGVEGSIFIPKGNLIFHSLSGSLRSSSGQTLYTIWDSIRVRIESINYEFNRIELSEAARHIMQA